MSMALEAMKRPTHGLCLFAVVPSIKLSQYSQHIDALYFELMAKPRVLLHIFSSLADDINTDLSVNEPFSEHCRCLSPLCRPIKASWMWFCGPIVSLLAKGIDTSLICVWIERQGQTSSANNISAMRRCCNFSNYLGITISYMGVLPMALCSNMGWTQYN